MVKKNILRDILECIFSSIPQVSKCLKTFPDILLLKEPHLSKCVLELKGRPFLHFYSKGSQGHGKRLSFPLYISLCGRAQLHNYFMYDRNNECILHFRRLLNLYSFNSCAVIADRNPRIGQSFSDCYNCTCCWSTHYLWQQVCIFTIQWLSKPSKLMPVSSQKLIFTFHPPSIISSEFLVAIIYFKQTLSLRVSNFSFLQLLCWISFINFHTN